LREIANAKLAALNSMALLLHREAAADNGPKLNLGRL
jgi:hypothetical protein